MQDEIDALSASYDAPGSAGDGGGGGSWNVTLADVCLAPLGSACATQSVLQYWGMSRDVFEHGETFLQAALCMQSCPAKVRHCVRAVVAWLHRCVSTCRPSRHACAYHSRVLLHTLDHTGWYV